MPKGDAKAAADAFRSVRIEPVMGKGIRDVAFQVRTMAQANLRGVPGTFSRSKVKITLQKNRSVEVQGLLAMVAEYGMGGRGWYYWGKKRSNSRVPPPRAVAGRPKPEDGYVVGAAYKRLRDDLTEHMADAVWDEYNIQFDRKGIYKVGAGSSGR